MKEMKPFDVTVKHLQGLYYIEAMEYLQQFSNKQLKEVSEYLGLPQYDSTKKILKDRIIQRSWGGRNCTCGSRLTNCVCK